MRKVDFYILAIVALCAVACGEEAQKNHLPEFKTFEYERCEEGKYNLTISYERIVNTSDNSAYAIIDSMNYHTTFGEYAIEPIDLNRSAELMCDDTLSSMDDYNIEDMQCEMHLYQVASLVRDNSVVCYDTVMETNFGGVYPIVSHTYECYDIATGNAYDFGYLAEGEWVEALQAAIFDKLVAQYGSSILFTSPDTTHLPSAIYLTEGGLVFQYQPYEVGTAALGSASVELSDAELAEIGVPLVWE